MSENPPRPEDPTSGKPGPAPEARGEGFLPASPTRDSASPIPELILALMVWLLCPTVCQATLLSLGVFSWYYGPAAVQLAQAPGEANPANPTLQETARLEVGRLTRLRMDLWSIVLAAPLQVVSIPLLLHGVGGMPPRRLGLTSRRWFRNLRVGVAVWLIVMPVVLGVHQLVLLLYQWGFSVVPAEHPLTRLADTGGLTAWEWVLWLSAAVVAAPVVEELVFRGLWQTWSARWPFGPELSVGVAGVVAVLFRWKALVAGVPLGGKALADALAPLVLVAFLGACLPLVRRYRPEMAVVWGSAAFFAMMHTSVWPSPVPLFLLGLALGELFRRTGSLVGPVTVHCLFNGTSVALYFLRLVPQ